jgi:tripartite-type tricarboxylate transporter receptor subunit TctC
LFDLTMECQMLLHCLRLVFAALAIFTGMCAAADADEPFYKGKHLTVLINYAPGGPTDVEGRLLAKYLVRHIEGTPTVIIQNKDGAAGLVGTNYLGELGPRDGTMVGYLTGAGWQFAMRPEKQRIDFRTYDFIGYSPGNAVYYARTDLPPGLKQASDIMKSTGLVAAGLGADSSKDMLIRVTLDMLGVPYKYVTGYRSSATARLAVQNGEASLHSETTPAYFAMVEPSLVKTGQVIPIWYDPNYNGGGFYLPKVMEHTSILPFQDFYRQVKGGTPSGPLWDAYLTNLSVGQELLRLLAMPPGSPQPAVDALRKAVVELNDDKEFEQEAIKVMQFAPHYETGNDLNERVSKMLYVKPETRDFVRAYIARAK